MIPGITAGSGESGPVDPDFPAVVALLHVEGGVLDEVIGLVSVTLVGDAAISADTAIFGTESIKNNGTSAQGTDYLLIEGPDDLLVFTGDYTFEMWVYVTAYSVEFINLIATPAGSGGGFQIASQDGQLYWNGPGGLFSSAAGALPISGWHFLSLSRNGTANRLSVDGVAVVTWTDGSAVGEEVAAVSPLLFGGAPRGSDNGDLDGYYEEIRITKGVGRYPADFTPPASPFPDA